MKSPEPLVQNKNYFTRVVLIFSGLDKDLDQWVFYPLLFNLMSYTPYLKYQIAENAKPCKKIKYLLNIF